MNHHPPFNRNFWLAAAVLSLVGGLALGQVTGLNDDLDAANTATAAAAAGLFSPERLEARTIDMQLRDIQDASSAGDFSEIDALLEEL